MPSKCFTECRRPNPSIPPAIDIMFGQAAFISSIVKINLFLLRLSSDNSDSCLIIL